MKRAEPEKFSASPMLKTRRAAVPPLACVFTEDANANDFVRKSILGLLRAGTGLTSSTTAGCSGTADVASDARRKGFSGYIVITPGPGAGLPDSAAACGALEGLAGAEATFVGEKLALGRLTSMGLTTDTSTSACDTVEGLPAKPVLLSGSSASDSFGWASRIFLWR